MKSESMMRLALPAMILTLVLLGLAGSVLRLGIDRLLVSLRAHADPLS